MGYPDGLHGKMTRYECAVAGYAALRHLRVLAGLAEPGQKAPRILPARQLREVARWFPVVEGLVRDLEPELSMMDMPKIRIEVILNEIATAFSARGVMINRSQGGRFSDVPVGHWAEGAVQTLRSLGLLSGYPDGRFRGNG